jgi:hypothetical protein
MTETNDSKRDLTEEEQKELKDLTKRVMNSHPGKSFTMKELDKDAFIVFCLSDLLLQVQNLERSLENLFNMKVAELCIPKEELDDMKVLICSPDVSVGSAEDSGDEPPDDSVN